MAAVCAKRKRTHITLSQQHSLCEICSYGYVQICFLKFKINVCVVFHLTVMLKHQLIQSTVIFFLPRPAHFLFETLVLFFNSNLRELRCFVCEKAAHQTTGHTSQQQINNFALVNNSSYSCGRNKTIDDASSIRFSLGKLLFLKAVKHEVVIQYLLQSYGKV